MRVRLDGFVCKRDASGNVIEVITLEKVSPLASTRSPALVPHHDPDKPECDVRLYTWVKLTETTGRAIREIEDQVIRSTKVPRRTARPTSRSVGP